MLESRLRFGHTGFAISRVGLGTFALGGGDWSYGWGAQDDADSIATIRSAISAGINWLETAAVYGLGHSEEIIGEALRGVPPDERPLVFTKGGMVWDERDRFATPRRIGRPDSLRREVDASLRRLRTDRIDLYQIHWPAADGTEIEDYWGALVELRAAGKLRAIGLCNHDIEQVRRAHAAGHVDSLQLPLSAIRRDTVAAARWCGDNGIAFLGWAPLQAGLLTGAFDRERVARLDPKDWRRSSPYFTSELEANLQVARAVEEVAKRRGTTPSAVAIAWTLTWPGVTAAIVGARRPAQLHDWLPGAELALDAKDLDDIALAIARSGCGVGPSRPRVPVPDTEKHPSREREDR